MRKIFLAALVFSAQIALAQAPDSLSFPASWAGQWSGELTIFNAKGLAHKIAMSLEINKLDTSATGRYSWGMVYVSKEKDWRPYEIVPVDPARGIWRVDEKNSISMESYLFGQKMMCWFVVEGSRVLCTYEKTGPDTIIFEVMTGPETPASTTGNTQQPTEAIPEVKTYPFTAFQRAVLRKKA